MGERQTVSSVYVHIPFCARQCGYCDFAIAVGRTPDAAGWRNAIAAEWATWLDRPDIAVAATLETVYVGGGTPSMLGAEGVEAVRAVLGRSRLAHPGLEWTVEANPESLDTDVLGAWRRDGVTRVSLGVQSFHEPTLRWMSRLHGPDGGERAVREIDAAGFASYTLDVIFGVPKALDRPWRADLDRVVALGAPHVSLYGLTVEPGTPLARAIREGRTEALDEGQYEEEYLEAAERLVAEGYEHYEVSSFARPGHRAKHNQRYWAGTPYIGLGNGAHSFIPPVRSWNRSAWPNYRDRALAGESTRSDSETVQGESARLEELWLGLRRTEGIGGDRLDPQLSANWVRRGLAFEDDDSIRLTARGWLVLDELVVAACSAEPPDS